MSDELASTLASIQEFMARTAQVFPHRISHGIPFHLSDHCESTPPPTATVLPLIVTTTNDTRLTEQEARSTVMRAHGIDEAQLVALFPMSLSGAAQRWFASVEPLRLRTWEDVAHEFLTQFAFSVDIDVAGMIDRLKEQDQIDMVLQNLQPSVKEVIARGLWTDATPSPNNKRKKLVGSSSRSGEVDTISYQHQRPALHSPYRPPTVRAHFSHPQYQYQPVYVQ
ncbi:hypothetical protein CK203_109774 [Vitis vinifera]|uniref:Retrotransposon gag domain-containing protein n=1 Tax=Vitis vinifera TaxID=29760 RepID=A0A438DLL7_VITVI|nr:hypothetical protein CK203_109774 [Vitis vinifera]